MLYEVITPPYSTFAPWKLDDDDGVALDRAGNFWFLTHAEEGPSGVANPTVNAVEYVSDTEIYIAGEFPSIGNLTLYPPNIARWDGGSWESLGLSGAPPTGSIVHDLEYRKGVLYVGTQECAGATCSRNNFV